MRDDDPDAWMYFYELWRSVQIKHNTSEIIKYQKTPWLDGLRERKLPDCLLQWPVIRVDV